ncbi:MAG: hypothetical protein QXX30_00890 [Candidatus Aenigmatarchaeota archaeon]
MTFIQMYLLNKQLSLISEKKQNKFEQVIKYLKPSYYDEYSDSITVFSTDFISSHNNIKNTFFISSTNKDKNNSILLSIFNTENQKEYKVKLFNKEKGFIDCQISSQGFKIDGKVIKPTNIHNFYAVAVSGALAYEKISAIFEENLQKQLFAKSIPSNEKGEKRIKVSMELNGESFVVQNPMAFAEAIRRTTTEFERYAGPFYMKKENGRTFIGYRTKEGEFIKEDEIIDKDIMYVSLLTDHPATIRTAKGKIVISSKGLRYINQNFKIDKLAKIRISFML